MKNIYSITLSNILIIFLHAFVNIYGSQSFNSIFFADPATGWAAGNSGVIFRTTDSGATWEMQDIGNIAKYKDIFHVFFPTSEIGWVCGSTYDYDYGYVLLFRKTTDGGAVWNEIDNPLKGPMYFTDADTGWASHEFTRNTIYKTINGGLDWKEQTIDPLTNDLESPHSIFFTDTENGWILCNTSSSTRLFKTSDGGKGWTEQTVGYNTLLTFVYFINSATGWACGHNGTILKTVNGGNDWVSRRIGTNNDLISVCFADRFTGWTCTGNEIFTTTDGGSTWRRIDLSGLTIAGTISALHYSTAETAWAVTKSGFIIRFAGDSASIAKYVSESEITPYYIHDSCGSCGSGSQLAFLPMFSCGFFSLFRKMRRKRKFFK